MAQAGEGSTGEQAHVLGKGKSEGREDESQEDREEPVFEQRVHSEGPPESASRSEPRE